MAEYEGSSSESESMTGEGSDRPAGEDMWVVTGSPSVTPPDSAGRALPAISPRMDGRNWHTNAPYVVEPTPLTGDPNIAIVPPASSPYIPHRIVVSSPIQTPNTSVRTVIPMGLDILNSSPASDTNQPRYTVHQQPIITQQQPIITQQQPIITQQQPTVRVTPYQAMPQAAQSPAMSRPVARQVPFASPTVQPSTVSNVQPLSRVNYTATGVDINPSAYSSWINNPSLRAGDKISPRLLPANTQHYNHDTVAPSVRKSSKYPYQVLSSPLVDGHGRMPTVVPRVADRAVLTKKPSQKWQTDRPASLLSYTTTTDRRFSVDTAPWSTKAEWMPAFRSGVAHYPDHIAHKHPAFPQSGIPSPLALYYFDETAPNPVLLRNDVPLAGVKKMANDLQRCDGCAGPQQKVATRGLMSPLSSTAGDGSTLGRFDEEMTMSSDSTTASHTDDPTSLRDTSMGTSAPYSSAFVLPSKQKQSGICCGGPASISSRQFTTSGKATTDYDIATTASRSGTSGVRVLSKPLSTARSGRSTARSGHSTSRSGVVYSEALSSKRSRSKQSVSRSPSRQVTSMSTFVPAHRQDRAKPKRNAICCGQDDYSSVRSRSKSQSRSQSRSLSQSESDTSMSTSSEGLTSASSLHQHHTAPDATSTPYIRVDPPSGTKSFLAAEVDRRYLSPERYPSSRRSSQSITAVSGHPRVASVASQTSRGRTSQRHSSKSPSRMKSGRSTISAYPGYVKKKRTDCCGNETVVLEPSSYAMDSFSRSPSVSSRKSIPYSATTMSRSKSKYSDHSRATRNTLPRQLPSRSSKTGMSMPQTSTDLSRWRSAAKAKKQGACCGGGDEQSYPLSYSGVSGSQSLDTSSDEHGMPASHRGKRGESSSSASGSSYMFSDSQSQVSAHSPSHAARPATSRASGRTSHTSRTGTVRRSDSRMSRRSRMTSGMEDFSFSRSTTFRSDFTRRRGACGPEKDLQYDVYKFFFDATDAKPAKRGTPYKMLPQFSTSYKAYPNVAYDVVAPRNRHDFMQSRRLPAFAA